jgi:hypothetical protein
MAPRSRRRHEILRVAQTLQALPHSDFMKGLTAATEAQLVLAVDGLGPSPSTTEIAATLQCAGWLVAAARGSTHPVAVRSARIAVGRCLYAARIALHEVPMDRDLLCAVMQPGPGSMVPGECHTAHMHNVFPKQPRHDHSQKNTCMVSACSA